MSRKRDPLLVAIQHQAGLELALTLNPRARAIYLQMVSAGCEPYFAALFAREDEALTRPADPTWQAVEEP